jgi:hypothetical protein
VRAEPGRRQTRNIFEGFDLSSNGKMPMNRAAAIARAQAYFDDGSFVTDLSRRIAIPSSSQEPSRSEALHSYLRDEIAPVLAPLGFGSHILDNPLGPPVLVAERLEDPAALKVLIYGHGRLRG